MKETCLKCHTQPHVDRVYQEAEGAVQATNAKITEAETLMAALKQEGLLTPEPFDEPVEFLFFDLWHYYGRTAKHGGFHGQGGLCAVARKLRTFIEDDRNQRDCHLTPRSPCKKLSGFTIMRSPLKSLRWRIWLFSPSMSSSLTRSTTLLIGASGCRFCLRSSLP